MKSVRREDWETLKPTVFGWGINDVNYNTSKGSYVYEGSVRKWTTFWRCPYYKKWKDMIKRCKSATHLKVEPTYRGCAISEDWKYLSNFIKWVDSQPNKNWQSCVLDKDILNLGSKAYSKDTCVFIESKLNAFILSRDNYRGNLMIGVKIDPSNSSNPFISRCNNPSKCKAEYIGSFRTELEAHKAWQAKKHEYALQLADLQDDPRVADALRQRYSPDKDWTNA